MRRVRLNVLQERLHPSVVAWNLANEVAGNGHYGGQPEYVDAAAQLVHRLDPGRPTAVDVWGTHMPDQAGLHVPPRRRRGRDQLRGLVRRHARPAGHRAGGHRRLARAPARDLPRQGADRQRVRRRGQPRSTRPAPRAPRASSRACSPATSAPTSRPRGSTASWSGTCRTSRSRRRSRAAPSAARCRHRPRARDQPEGPVHLRRAAKPAVAAVRGRSRAERRGVRVVVRVRVVLRGAYCASREGGWRWPGAALRARRSRRGVCAFERLQHLRARPRGGSLTEIGRATTPSASPRCCEHARSPPKRTRLRTTTAPEPPAASPSMMLLGAATRSARRPPRPRPDSPPRSCAGR